MIGVGVMAKAPVPGHCKTRLCPPLSHLEAARLYAALLTDTVAMVRAYPVALTLFAAPERDGVAHLNSLFPHVAVAAQCPGDLGARMQHALASMLADGCEVALVLGGDAPLVPLGAALEACARIREAPGRRVLCGPSDDGGYWTIGMDRVHPALFEGVAWSTAQVMASTRELARREGLDLVELPLSDDVDDAAALERFTKHLQQGANAPASRALLLGDG